jgi:hypothetical protein
MCGISPKYPSVIFQVKLQNKKLLGADAREFVAVGPKVENAEFPKKAAQGCKSLGIAEKWSYCYSVGKGQWWWYSQ